MKTVINELLNRSLLANVIGNMPQDVKLGIVIWAKHKPRYDNLPLLALASLLSEQSPNIYVDDVASRVFCKRSIKEQATYNVLYRDFFESRGCNVTFSSDIYQSKFDGNVLEELYALTDRISISRFVRCLPEKKLSSLDTLRSSEILNLVLELFLFEQLGPECNVLIVRHFTQGVVMAHHKLHTDQLSALVIPRLEDQQAIDRYIANIKDILS